MTSRLPGHYADGNTTALTDLFEGFLSANNTLVLDGGLATALESRGHNLNHALWSAKLLREDPGAIRHVHRDYFLAGADVAITASYQASVAGLQKHLGLDTDQANQVIRDSVHLAIQAREEVAQLEPGRKMFVAGSVGPYGAYLANGAEYTGEYGSVTTSELEDFHRNRIATLLEAGANVLACETIPSRSEALVLRDLLQSDFPKSRAWISFTLRDAEHLSDGSSVRELVAMLENYDQIVAVGFNCIPLDLASDALAHLQPSTSKPLIIYPNSGEKWDGAKKEWYGKAAAAEQLPELAEKWRQRGARLVGGCCRMGFEDISLIGKACPYTRLDSGGCIGPQGRGLDTCS